MYSSLLANDWNILGLSYWHKNSHFALALPDRRAEMIVTDPIPTTTHSCFSYTVTSSTLRKCQSDGCLAPEAWFHGSDIRQPTIALAQQHVDHTLNASSLKPRKSKCRARIPNAQLLRLSQLGNLRHVQLVKLVAGPRWWSLRQRLVVQHLSRQ